MKQQTLGGETAEPISPGPEIPDTSPSQDEIKQALDKEPTIPDNPEDEDDQDEEAETSPIQEKRHVPRKVEIVIKDTDADGKPFKFTSTDEKQGKPFISVSFMANTYGCASPCENEEDVKQTVKWQEETIREAGDLPIIKDEREASKLNKFMMKGDLI